jgi:hypothetical protein
MRGYWLTLDRLSNSKLGFTLQSNLPSGKSFPKYNLKNNLFIVGTETRFFEKVGFLASDLYGSINYVLNPDCGQCPPYKISAKINELSYYISPELMNL